MKILEVNKHQAGRLSNMVFGLACVLDGLVRILSCGWLHTSLPLLYSKYQVTVLIKNKLMKQRGLQSEHP